MTSNVQEGTIPANFLDKQYAQTYGKIIGKFVPGLETVHRLTTQLLTEYVGDEAKILVVGAGGGLEMKVFGEARPGWKYVAVDPSSAHLDQAKVVIGEAQSQLVEWVNGYTQDAPKEECDGATMLLTMHLLKDDGTKLNTLKEIHCRLKPNAPLVVFDPCSDVTTKVGKLWLDRYCQYALESGVAPEMVSRSKSMILASHTSVTTQREEELLREAGFEDIQMFYSAVTLNAYICKAKK